MCLKFLLSLISERLSFISKHCGHSRRNGSILVICLVFCCIVGVLIFFFDADSFRYAKNLYVFMGNAETFLDSLPKNKTGKGSWTWMDERNFVESEDPRRIRLLHNSIGEYERIDRLGEEILHETIELKASQSRVRPGAKVAFEAAFSPETPRTRSRIMLYCTSFSKTTTLSRAKDGKYTGSFRFAKSDAGEFRFFVTFPWKDDKTGAITLYGSNPVTVFVAPDAAQLERIAFSGTERGDPLFTMEGKEMIPVLIADGPRDQKYDLSNPGLGTLYSTGDEALATVTDKGTVLALKPGKTTLRAVYQNLETEAQLYIIVDPTSDDLGWLANVPPEPRPDRPHAVSPPDGTVVHVGDRVVLEVSSFDSSKGHQFDWSIWSVKKFSPMGHPIKVAHLGKGDSNIAEWIPRGTGTFEWTMQYSWSGPGISSLSSPDFSPPMRIIVVE